MRRIDALAIFAYRASRRGLLAGVPLFAAGVRSALASHSSSCVEPNQPCAYDDQCCSHQCDDYLVRGQRVCRPGASSDACRRVGAPCDPNVAPGNAAACCAPGWCQASGGNDGYGGFLPAYTCRGPAGGCPDGRDPCPTRHYSGIGPQVCCAPGDTCSGGGAGCIAGTCNINNESNQDVWGTASCGGSEWCLCAITPHGEYACLDFSGSGICDPAVSPRCTVSADCAPGQECTLLLPQWCGAWLSPGNNTGTIRTCRPRCGA